MAELGGISAKGQPLAGQATGACAGEALLLLVKPLVILGDIPGRNEIAGLFSSRLVCMANRGWMAQRNWCTKYDGTKTHGACGPCPSR